MKIEQAGVLITGGGRGLGAALAEELAGADARVAIVARSEGELARVAEASLGRIATVRADVSDKSAAYAIAGIAAARIGNIDVLVHNASTLGPSPLRLLIDTPCEDF